MHIVNMTSKDLKGPQTTSNDIKTTQTNTKTNRRNKKILKKSVHENVEINEHYFDYILQKNIL